MLSGHQSVETGVQVNIVRGLAAPQMTRRDVVTGQVFALRKRNGDLGSRRYAAIGENGLFYSVDVESGELCSSDNVDKPVTLIGTFVYNINNKPMPGVERNCLRSEVHPGEVFTVVGKNGKLYMNMGKITCDHVGWLSIPANNTENHAYTTNGNSHVNVVATFGINVTLVQ